MNTVVVLIYVLVGVINVLPIVGVISVARLSSLYGVSVESPDLALLLQHRAVLFGLLGGLLISAAWTPSVRTPAALAGIISMLSFCVLTVLLNVANPALVRIAWIDVVAVVLLAIGVTLHRVHTTAA
ncbi:MAG: phosphopantetheine adenylyltransferase [Pseudomonadota bacterium]